MRSSVTEKRRIARQVAAFLKGHDDCYCTENGPWVCADCLRAGCGSDLPPDPCRVTGYLPINHERKA